MLLPESLPPTAPLFLLLLTQTFRIEAPQMILPDQTISSSVGQDPSSPVLSFVQKSMGDWVYTVPHMAAPTSMMMIDDDQPRAQAQ